MSILCISCVYVNYIDMVLVDYAYHMYMICSIFTGSFWEHSALLVLEHRDLIAGLSKKVLWTLEGYFLVYW